MLRNSLISLVLLLLFWQGFVLIFHLPTYVFPSPKDVLIALMQSWKIMTYQASITLFETLLGLSLGMIGGIFTAIILATFRPLQLFLLPLILISQALPTFAIAPILVLWLGFGMTSKIVVVMLMTFFPITSALFDGLKKTPPHYLEMAKHMRGKKINRLKFIYLPFALPYLASGLRVSAVFAPMGAIIGEWVGASRGLGYLIVNANARVETSLVFAAVIILVLMALSLYYIMDVFFKSWIKW